MAGNVDNRVVSMKFDNKGFEKGVATTQKTLSKLKDALAFKGGKKGIEDVSKAAGNVKGFQQMGDQVSSVEARFGALQVAAVTALATITTKAVDAGIRLGKALTLDNVIDGFREYESNINAVQTILANTESKGGTLEGVNAALDELNTYADQTIYNFSEMTRNIGTFTAAGVGLDESVRSIKGIANIAAVSGSNSQQASTAMYQLSQALAAGSLKLQDWNSVVNAGMGGEVFQNALFETGKALGTLDGVGLDTTFQDWKDAGNSFRESLQDQWITTEVLTTTLEGFTGELSKADLVAKGYSESQADAILKMAKTASDAATNVKTATQLVGVIQESIGSGWASTFRIVLGDFEDAKRLFSGIAEAITGPIGRMTEARNFLLQGWDESGGRDAFFAGLLNSFDALQRVIAPIRLAFREFFPRTTVQQLGELSQKFADFTDKLKIGEGGMKKIYNVAKIFFGVLRLGFEIVFGITRVLFKLGSILVSVGSKIASFILGFAGFEALGNIFGKAGSISAFFDAIIAGIDGAYGLLGSFAGFVKSKLGPAIDFIKDAFGTAKNAVSDFASGIADQFSGIEGVFNTVKKKVEDFVGTIQGLFGGGGGGRKSRRRSRKGQRGGGSGGSDGSFLGDLLGYYTSGIDAAKDAFALAVNDIEKTINRIKEALTLDNIASGAGNALAAVGDFFGNMGESISNASEAVWEFAGNFKQSIADAFGSETYDKILDGAQTGILGVVAAALGKLAFGGLDINFGFVDEILDTFDQLTDTLKAMENNIKANTIKQIAISVAILAGSMIALSFLDGDQIRTSLIAMGSGLSALLASLYAMSKIDSSGIKMPVLAASLSLISASLIVFAGAILLFSTIPTDRMIDGGIKIAAAMAVLTGAAFVLGKAGPGIFSASVAMVVMSGALLALSYVIQKYTEIGWNDMAYGLGSIAVALGILVLAMRAMPIAGMFSASIAMGIMAFSLSKIADVVTTFARLGLGDLVKGLGALAITLGILVAVMYALGKLDVGKASLGMGVMAASLYVISLAIEKIAQIDIVSVAKAVIALAIVLGGLVVAALAIQTASAGVVGILALAGALWIIGNILQELGKMSLGEVGIALLAIAGVLIVLGLAAGVLTAFPPLAAGLVVMAGALLAIGAGFALMGAGAWLAVDALAKVKDVSDESIDKIIKIVDKFVKKVPEWAIKFAEGLGEFVIALLEMVPKINEAMGTALSSIINLIVEKTPEITNMFGVIIEASVELMREKLPLIADFVIEMILVIGEKINENIQTIVELGASIIANFIAGMVTSVETIGPEIINLLEAIGGYMVEHVSTIVDIAVDILVALIDGMADAVEDITDSFIGLLEAIRDAIIDIADTVIDAGVEIFDEVLNGMAQAAEDISEDMRTLIIAIKDAIIGVAGEAAGAGKDILLAVIYGAIVAIKDISDAFKALAQTLADEVVAQIEVWGQAGIDILKALLEEAATRASEAAMEFGKFLVAVAEGIEDAVAENTEPLFAAGRGIVRELINGMIDGLGLRSAVDGLRNALSGLVDKLPGWAQKVLEIFSPSRVFMRIGEQIPAGLAEGIKHDQAALDATGDLAVGVTDKFAEAMHQASFAMERDIQPTITPVLDLGQVQSQSKKLLRYVNPDLTAQQLFFLVALARKADPGGRYSNEDLAEKALGWSPGATQYEDFSWKRPSGWVGQEGRADTRVVGGVVFNQTINSPHALSTSTIYRQTRGQITVAKEKLRIP